MQILILAKQQKHIIPPDPLQLFEQTNSQIIEQYAKGIESGKLTGSFAKKIYQQCKNLEYIRAEFLFILKENKQLKQALEFASTPLKEIIRQEKIQDMILLDSYNHKHVYNLIELLAFYSAASHLEIYAPLPKEVPNSALINTLIEQYFLCKSQAI